MGLRLFEADVDHFRGTRANPPEIQRTTMFMEEDSTVYFTMNGPNEFFCIGPFATGRCWTRCTGSSPSPCSPRLVMTRRGRGRSSPSSTIFPKSARRSSRTPVTCLSSKSPSVTLRSSGRSSPCTTSRSSDEPLAIGPMARYGLTARTYGGSSG